MSTKQAQRCVQRLKATLGLAAGALAIQAPAFAQQAGLEEITVTARFREENLQQTPLAITAISADQLAERGQTSLTEITADAPSVSLSPEVGAFGPSMAAFIRGIGQADLDPALEPGVGIYIDDVYFGTLTGSLLDLLDLDRVDAYLFAAPVFFLLLRFGV